MGKRVAVTKKELQAKERAASLQLTDWLLSAYSCTLLTKRFYIKLSQVYKGEYRGQARPCPPEDLLDMWKQKKDYLDKLCDYNRRKGKDLQGEQRINYDLSVLLAKYGDYLNWKERQARADSLNKQANENKKLSDTVSIISSMQSTSKSPESIDINSILDEI